MKKELLSKPFRFSVLSFSDSPFLVGVLQLICIAITTVGVGAIMTTFYNNTFVNHQVLGASIDVTSEELRQKIDEQVERLVQIRSQSRSAQVEKELNRLKEIVE